MLDFIKPARKDFKLDIPPVFLVLVVAERIKGASVLVPFRRGDDITGRQNQGDTIDFNFYRCQGDK